MGAIDGRAQRARSTSAEEMAYALLDRTVSHDEIMEAARALDRRETHVDVPGTVEEAERVAEDTARRTRSGTFPTLDVATIKRLWMQTTDWQERRNRPLLLLLLKWRDGVDMGLLVRPEIVALINGLGPVVEPGQVEAAVRAAGVRHLWKADTTWALDAPGEADKDAIAGEIAKLRARGVVEAADPRDGVIWINEMFMATKDKWGAPSTKGGVPIKGIGEKKRCVMNCSTYNGAWVDAPFNLQGVEMLFDSLDGNLIGVTDVISGFHTILLQPTSRNFFAFRHEGEILRMTRLPFGAKLSPAIFGMFSALAAAVAQAETRRAGVAVETVAVFVDDMAVTAAPGVPALAMVRGVLAALGLATAKIQQMGRQVRYLGYEIDTGTHIDNDTNGTPTIGLSGTTVERLRREIGWISDAIGSKRAILPAEFVEAALGHLNWAQTAWPGLRTLGAGLYGALAARRPQFATIMTPMCMRDVEAVLQEVERGYSPMALQVWSTGRTVLLETDATERGCAGRWRHVDGADTWSEFHAVWDDALPATTAGGSTTHELIGAAVGLEAIAASPAFGRRVIWATDSAGAAFAVTRWRGAGREALGTLRWMLEAMRRAELEMHPRWRPRELMAVADHLAERARSEGAVLSRGEIVEKIYAQVVRP